VRVVELTREGRRLIVPAFARHAKDLEHVVATALTSHERTTLVNLLRKLGTSAER